MPLVPLVIQAKEHWNAKQVSEKECERETVV